MTIAVLGAGNWGTTAALLLHGNGHGVRLWEFNERLARDMIEHRENRTYLPGVPIPEDLTVTWRIDEALADAECVVFVAPSEVMVATASAAAASEAVRDDALLVSLSKGLEQGSLAVMTSVIGDALPDRQLVAVSGPCIATEVSHRQPTTVVAAAEDHAAAHIVQDMFMTPYFRVYTWDDPLGVQLGGALKNIIAIAAGVGDGLGYGANAKSALVTRGIVEIKRLGEALGANPDTFNGLSGIGDLITTCFSEYSRNRHVGEEIGRGRTLEAVREKMVMVAEGVNTTRIVHDSCRERGIDMPITAIVHGILFEGIAPREAVGKLMQRDPKPEQ